MNYIDPTHAVPTLTANQRAFRSYKEFCFKNKWYLFSSIFLLTLFFTQYFTAQFSYSSQVEVAFKDIEIAINKEAVTPVPGFTKLPESTNRIYQLIYSKEMFNHLLSKFNLYEHYFIDPTKSNAYSFFLKKLRNKISIAVTPYNSIIITVQDKYSGALAADIANEIVLELNELNKQSVRDYIQKRIELYSEVAKQLNSSARNEIMNINESVDKIQSLMHPLSNKYTELVRVGLELDNFNAKLNNYVQNIIQVDYLSKMSFEKVQNENITQLIVLQDAQPDDGSKKLSFLKLFFGSFVGCTFIMLFVFYFLQMGTPYFDILFRKETSLFNKNDASGKL
jgi:hypothetical protein